MREQNQLFTQVTGYDKDEMKSQYSCQPSLLSLKSSLFESPIDEIFQNSILYEDKPRLNYPCDQTLKKFHTDIYTNNEDKFGLKKPNCQFCDHGYTFDIKQED